MLVFPTHQLEPLSHRILFQTALPVTSDTVLYAIWCGRILDRENSHAGYAYCGACGGVAYKQVDPSRV